MKLLQYYRKLFQNAVDYFDPGWKEAALDEHLLLYRWHRQVSIYPETFRIWAQDQATYLTYAIEIPGQYEQTDIAQFIKSMTSQYEISSYTEKGMLVLQSTVDTARLHQSVLGFLYKSRVELADMIDFSVLTSEFEERSGTCG